MARPVKAPIGGQVLPGRANLPQPIQPKVVRQPVQPSVVKAPEVVTPVIEPAQKVVPEPKLEVSGILETPTVETVEPTIEITEPEVEEIVQTDLESEIQPIADEVTEEEMDNIIEEALDEAMEEELQPQETAMLIPIKKMFCLLYTSDAADE